MAFRDYGVLCYSGRDHDSPVVLVYTLHTFNGHGRLITLIAVTWQMGVLATLGYELDPFSILVPFLVISLFIGHAEAGLF